jgi:hypothetical protein
MNERVHRHSGHQPALYSRPAATRQEALEVVAPQILDEAIAREKARSWFIGEVIVIKVEQDPTG